MMEKICVEADVTIFMSTKLTQTGHKMTDHSGTYSKDIAENGQMHNQTLKISAKAKQIIHTHIQFRKQRMHNKRTVPLE